MVWFEPERVYKGSAWDNSYPQWMLGDASSNKLYNLADSAALDYLCKYIGDFLEHNDIDYYRQDFNMYAENIWKTHDKEGREGITENHYIEGLYKYWDYLLNRFPTLLIDNCASGGRRIDYETVLRSAPLWRTDYHYGEPYLRVRILFAAARHRHLLHRPLRFPLRHGQQCCFQLETHRKKALIH